MGKKKAQGKKGQGKKVSASAAKKELIAKIKGGDVSGALTLIENNGADELGNKAAPKKNLLQICLENTTPATDCSKLIAAMLAKDIIEKQNLSSLKIDPSQPIAINEIFSLFEKKDGRKVVIEDLIANGEVNLILIADQFYRDLGDNEFFVQLLRSGNGMLLDTILESKLQNKDQLQEGFKILVTSSSISQDIAEFIGSSWDEIIAISKQELGKASGQINFGKIGFLMQAVAVKYHEAKPSLKYIIQIKDLAARFSQSSIFTEILGNNAQQLKIKDAIKTTDGDVLKLDLYSCYKALMEFAKAKLFNPSESHRALSCILDTAIISDDFDLYREVLMLTRSRSSSEDKLRDLISGAGEIEKTRVFSTLAAAVDLQSSEDMVRLIVDMHKGFDIDIDIVGSGKYAISALHSAIVSFRNVTNSYCWANFHKKSDLSSVIVQLNILAKNIKMLIAAGASCELPLSQKSITPITQKEIDLAINFAQSPEFDANRPQKILDQEYGSEEVATSYDFRNRLYGHFISLEERGKDNNGKLWNQIVNLRNQYKRDNLHRGMSLSVEIFTELAKSKRYEDLAIVYLLTVAKEMCASESSKQEIKGIISSIGVTLTEELSAKLSEGVKEGAGFDLVIFALREIKGRPIAAEKISALMEACNKMDGEALDLAPLIVTSRTPEDLASYPKDIAEILYKAVVGEFTKSSFGNFDSQLYNIKLELMRNSALSQDESSKAKFEELKRALTDPSFALDNYPKHFARDVIFKRLSEVNREKLMLLVKNGNFEIIKTTKQSQAEKLDSIITTEIVIAALDQVDTKNDQNSRSTLEALLSGKSPCVDDHFVIELLSQLAQSNKLKNLEELILCGFFRPEQILSYINSEELRPHAAKIAFQMVGRVDTECLKMLTSPLDEADLANEHMRANGAQIGEVTSIEILLRNGNSDGLYQYLSSTKLDDAQIEHFIKVLEEGSISPKLSEYLLSPKIESDIEVLQNIKAAIATSPAAKENLTTAFRARLDSILEQARGAIKYCNNELLFNSLTKMSSVMKSCYDGELMAICNEAYAQISQLPKYFNPDTDQYLIKLTNLALIDGLNKASTAISKSEDEHRRQKQQVAKLLLDVSKSEVALDAILRFNIDPFEKVNGSSIFDIVIHAPLDFKNTKSRALLLKTMIENGSDGKKDVIVAKIKEPQAVMQIVDILNSYCDSAEAMQLISSLKKIGFKIPAPNFDSEEVCPMKKILLSGNHETVLIAKTVCEGFPFDAKKLETFIAKYLPEGSEEIAKILTAADSSTFARSDVEAMGGNISFTDEVQEAVPDHAITRLEDDTVDLIGEIVAIQKRVAAVKSRTEEVEQRRKSAEKTVAQSKQPTKPEEAKPQPPRVTKSLGSWRQKAQLRTEEGVKRENKTTQTAHQGADITWKLELKRVEEEIKKLAAKNAAQEDLLSKKSSQTAELQAANSTLRRLQEEVNERIEALNREYKKLQTKFKKQGARIAEAKTSTAEERTKNQKAQEELIEQQKHHEKQLRIKEEEYKRGLELTKSQLESQHQRQLATLNQKHQQDIGALRKQNAAQLDALRAELLGSHTSQLEDLRAELGRSHASQLETLRAELEKNNTAQLEAMRMDMDDIADRIKTSDAADRRSLEIQLDRAMTTLAQFHIIPDYATPPHLQQRYLEQAVAFLQQQQALQPQVFIPQQQTLQAQGYRQGSASMEAPKQEFQAKQQGFYTRPQRRSEGGLMAHVNPQDKYGGLRAADGLSQQEGREGSKPVHGDDRAVNKRNRQSKPPSSVSRMNHKMPQGHRSAFRS